MMGSDGVEERVKSCASDGARLRRPSVSAGNAIAEGSNHAPSQRPHGMAVCRQSIAKSAISCGAWQGGIDTLLVYAICSPLRLGIAGRRQRTLGHPRTKISPDPTACFARLCLRSRLRASNGHWLTSPARCR